MSHARFCGRGAAVTSATDGAIACWDLSSSVAVLAHPLHIHRGHAHRRNFVGLSARPSAAGHLIASGSEDGRVVAYSSLHLQHLASWRLQQPQAPSQQDAALQPQQPLQRNEQVQGRGGEFVSAVVWAPVDSAATAANLLAVAGSDGNVSVLELQE